MRFFLLILAVGVTVPHSSGCNAPEDVEKRSRKRNESRETINIGIATISTPNNWKPNRSGGNTAIIFTPTNDDRNDPAEMISIDIGTPNSKDAKGSAKILAKKFNGAVHDLSFSVDGEIGFKVSVPPNYDQLMPRECVVTHHGDKVCFIFGGSKSQGDIWPTVVEIAKSIKWK